MDARVMLVDDHPVVRHGLRMVIEAETGLEVCGEASDLSSALELLSSAPDLVLLDLSLGDNSGLELLEHLPRGGPRVLVLSIHDEEVYAERSLRAGASGYLMKDAPPAEIVRGIHRVLAGELVLSPKMTSVMLRRATGQEPERPPTPIDTLSDQERRVFQLVGRGETTRAIAATLDIRPKTVDTHKARIRKKLDLDNSAQLTHAAVRWVLEMQTADDAS